MTKLKARLAGLLVFLSFGIVTCGKIPTASQPELGSSIEDTNQGIPVKGHATLGHQCPYGSYAPPQPVPLSLWGCQLPIPEVELLDPLQALVIQVDCKKMTIDVRGVRGGLSPTTWEIMPDGNFSVSINAGTARLKEDGNGGRDCEVPLGADIWGKIDCSDRDKAVINMETLWWLDRIYINPGSASPTPSPSSSASPAPTGIPSGLPSATPSPASSAGPTEWPFPPLPVPTFRFPFSSPATLENSVEETSRPRCKLPSGCYLHNRSKFQQCS